MENDRYELKVVFVYTLGQAHVGACRHTPTPTHTHARMHMQRHKHVYTNTHTHSQHSHTIERGVTVIFTEMMHICVMSTARLRKPQDGLFTGTIEALDTVDNTYRVTFDKPGLGTHSIPDYEVLVSSAG